MSVHILSKMTNSVSYRTYRFIGNANESKNQSLLPIPNGDNILIRGGANRSSQTIGFGDQSQDVSGNMLWTPAGVVTSITDEQYSRLKDNWLFKKHVENGHLEVVNASAANNHKEVIKIANGMASDNSAPLTKATIQGRVKVSIPTSEIEQ